MSDSGQGDGQRSWWEKPDPEPAPQDPYAAGRDPGAGDAHDPYRTGGPDDATRANPTQTPPTESLPRYGEQQQSWSSPQSSPSSPQSSPYGGHPHGGPDQYGQQGQYGQYGQQGGPQGGPQNQQYPGYADQYGNQQYGNQQYGNQQFGNQQFGHPGQQPPVAGMAHAVLWTAVGGLVLFWTGLGWIASIVALALTPGARRDIQAAGGAKRGLGYLLAGKICAWVNIGISVLVVAAFIGLAVWAASTGGFDSGSTVDAGGVDVLFPR